MKTIDILKAARAKIADPVHWTQGYYAKNQYGLDVSGNDADATCFCTLGAIESVTGVIHREEGWPSDAVDFLERAVVKLAPADKMFTRSVAEFNDTRTHGEVLVVWDKAIEFAENAAG